MKILINIFYKCIMHVYKYKYFHQVIQLKTSHHCHVNTCRAVIKSRSSVCTTDYILSPFTPIHPNSFHFLVFLFSHLSQFLQILPAHNKIFLTQRIKFNAALVSVSRFVFFQKFFIIWLSFQFSIFIFWIFFFTFL